MRDRARAVVIGGGVGGCAILYWLARLGWDDVVLVERAELTSGSTFHSAGLVGQLRSSLSLTRMMMESVELYRTLESEVQLETGWHEVGSLRLASTEERLEEIARQAGWAKTFGLPLELVSAEEAQRLFPPISTDGVLGAAFLPTDGYVDPSQLTFALAEGARRRGAEIEQRTRVLGIRTRRGRVEAVETDRGEIETETVVNAGGMYAREIGAFAGVNVPIVPMAHEYLVTKPAGFPLEMPTMRDPSLLVYFRRSELEFYLLRQSYQDAWAQRYEDLTPSVPYILDYHVLATTYDEDLIRQIRNGMHAAGIKVETSKGEAWPGQHEINFRFADALTMADNHVVSSYARTEQSLYDRVVTDWERTRYFERG